MALEWSQSLSVGNGEIDCQHKELFVRVNKLIEAMEQKKGKEEIGKVISFLENYVIEHFGLEEKYMSAINYPKLTYHRLQHADFKSKFNMIKKKYEENGPGLETVVHIHNYLGKWLMEHIPTVDKELAESLHLKKTA